MTREELRHAEDIKDKHTHGKMSVIMKQQPQEQVDLPDHLLEVVVAYWHPR
jgi:hypothetical protein